MFHQHFFFVKDVKTKMSRAWDKEKLESPTGIEPMTTRKPRGVYLSIELRTWPLKWRSKSFTGFVYETCVEHAATSLSLVLIIIIQFLYCIFFFLFPDLVCSVQTENGEACVFPFSYNGFVFNGCTDYDVNGPDIKPWCMTSSSWGYCAGTMWTLHLLLSALHLKSSKHPVSTISSFCFLEFAKVTDFF